MKYIIDSCNFFEKIDNVKNDEKNILDFTIGINVDYLVLKRLDEIVDKLFLEYDKIKIYFNLSHCNLVKIPESIFKLVNIYELYLIGNWLTYIPDDISKLINLDVLRINCNNIKYISPEISKLSKLTYLDISYNSFEIVPEIIYSLKFKIFKYENIFKI